MRTGCDLDCEAVRFKVLSLVPSSLSLGPLSVASCLCFHPPQPPRPTSSSMDFPDDMTVNPTFDRQRILLSMRKELGFDAERGTDVRKPPRHLTICTSFSSRPLFINSSSSHLDDAWS